MAFLKDISLGSPNIIYFKELKASDTENISNCFLVRQTLCYLFTIIISYIFYKIENRNSGGNEIFTSSKNLDEGLDRKTTGDIEYIHREVHLVEYPFKKLLPQLLRYIISYKIFLTLNHLHQQKQQQFEHLSHLRQFLIQLSLALP